MKLNRNGYLLIGGIAVGCVVLFYMAKKSSAPASIPVNSVNQIGTEANTAVAQTTQAPTTNQHTAAMEASIKTNLDNVFSQISPLMSSAGDSPSPYPPHTVRRVVV